MTARGARTYALQALTDIWTGDARTAQSKEANRLIPTGLLGSVRWWFEVLVRGLGGAPCDPSANQKSCLGDQDDQHCVVCELFGCTGWARKFRFDLRDARDGVITSQLAKGATFQLRFTPLRSVRAEEWALLELTLRVISEFAQCFRPDWKHVADDLEPLNCGVVAAAEVARDHAGGQLPVAPQWPPYSDREGQSATQRLAFSERGTDFRC